MFSSFRDLRGVGTTPKCYCTVKKSRYYLPLRGAVHTQLTTQNCLQPTHPPMITSSMVTNVYLTEIELKVLRLVEVFIHCSLTRSLYPFVWVYRQKVILSTQLFYDTSHLPYCFHRISAQCFMSVWLTCEFFHLKFSDH